MLEVGRYFKRCFAIDQRTINPMRQQVAKPNLEKALHQITVITDQLFAEVADIIFQ